MEWIIISMVTLSTVLYAIGGTGFKWARRFVMPVVLGVGAFLLGAGFLRSFIFLILTSGAMHLGYGEGSGWIKRILTMLAMAVCLLPLANGASVLLTLLIPLAFGIGWYLSNKFNWFSWKICELGMGFTYGATAVLLCLSS